MSKIVIRSSDVPKFCSIFLYIRYKTDIVKRFKKLPKPKFNFYELQFSYDLVDLKQSVLSALDQYGMYGWLTSSGRLSRSSYQSLSLVYNSNLNDSKTNEFNSTLGSSKISTDGFFYGNVKSLINMKFQVKNSYYDSWNFKEPNSVMLNQLSQFSKEFLRTQIRSRVSVITSNATESLKSNYLLHRDEPVYENLRVNIPIVGSDKYFLMLDKQDHNLRPGHAYTWDSNLPHRVYGVDRQPRVNLVLGFVPWFDYHVEDDVWISNEYYGNYHPIDMVKDGFVIKSVSM